MDFAPSVVGLLVGFLVGLTGVGGAALMTPALVMLFGVAPQTAVGTDILFAFLTKIAGGSVHGRRNAIDWMVVRRLCWGSLPGALCALLSLRILAVNGLSGGFILQALGLTLVITSLALVFKTRLRTIGQHLRSTRPARFKHAQPVLTVVAGFVIGVLVTVTSVGAGALGAAALSYLYPYRLSAQRLVGTDIAHAVPLTLVAGAGHFALGNVDTSLLLTLLLGSIPGIVFGALAAHRIGEAHVRLALAVVLSIVGVKLVLGG